MKEEHFSKSSSSGAQTISAVNFGSSTTDSNGLPLHHMSKGSGTVVSVGTLKEVHVSTADGDVAGNDSKVR